MKLNILCSRDGISSNRDSRVTRTVTLRRADVNANDEKNRLEKKSGRWERDGMMMRMRTVGSMIHVFQAYFSIFLIQNTGSHSHQCYYFTKMSYRFQISS